MSNSTPKIAILAGEASGDQLGARLIKGLLQHRTSLHIAGIGGKNMNAAGLDCWWHSDELAVFGLVEVIQHVPRLLKLRRQLLTKLVEWQPELVITIDAPDFYLPLAARLKKNAIPVIHYVCPSVWAWRQNRVQKIRKSVDHLLCLLPFEQQFLSTHRVAATFVGHPLTDTVKPLPSDIQAEKRKQYGEPDNLIIAILPGSRNSELQRHTTNFFESCQRLQKELSGTITILSAVSKPEHRERLLAAHQKHCSSLRLKILPTAGEALAVADVALVASGTVTLEAMLYQCPMVVGYILNPVTWQIMDKGKLYKADHIALPNLLAGERLVPELLQKDASPEQLALSLLDVLQSDTVKLKRRFAELSTLLKNPDQQVDDVIWEQLSR